MRHALYSTPHGKTRTEIQDLGGSSQTIATSTYDALDRLTLATAPEGNTVGYTYDLASNVLTITRTPKPGSALSPLVTTTTYDPTFNKPLTVTDPRGLVTASGRWRQNMFSSPSSNRRSSGWRTPTSRCSGRPVLG